MAEKHRQDELLFRTFRYSFVAVLSFSLTPCIEGNLQLLSLVMHLFLVHFFFLSTHELLVEANAIVGNIANASSSRYNFNKVLI